MKRICIAMLCVVIMLANISIIASAHIKPDEISINDYSGVISQGVKDYVSSNNKLLFEQTKAKIIIVTTDNTNYSSIDSYAKNLYTSWNISSMGRGNSVFVLISPSTEDYSIIQGKNISRVLTDSKLYEIIVKSFEPHFAAKNYDDAVLSLYNSLGSWYEENYNGLELKLDNSFSLYKTGEVTKDIEKQQSKLWLWIACGGVVVIFIVFINIKNKLDFKQRQQERKIKRKRSKADIDKITNS